MNSLCILGRQPALGMAELESLYGADKLRPVGNRAVMVDVDPCLLAFDRLGGTVKFCKYLTKLDTTDWRLIEKFLLEVSPGHSQRMPAGKMRLGLSVIGMDVNLKQLEATGLKLKKAIRATGRSVRLVPNKEPELSSAQVIHNQLTGATGWELIFIHDGKSTHIVQTVRVQDIESYTIRDRGRPKRDSRVGMLPPKLAQIIINLAVGELPAESRQSVCEIPPDQPIPPAHYEGIKLLDPFCGTGVILQEALLMGYDVYGSDVQDRMVDYSKANLDWLAERQSLEGLIYLLETGDATDYRWQDFTVVASETYLGRPFTDRPDTETLARTVSECNTIIKKFLENIAGQTRPGTRFCLAVPAWRTDDGFKHLPLVDHLTEIGYTRLSFAHAKNDELIYYREGQIVARELLVITRK